MKTVIEMAQQVEAEGFAPINIWPEVRRLCELVRADEREACAKVCGDLHIEGEDDTGLAADLIRARSKT